MTQIAPDIAADVDPLFTEPYIDVDEWRDAPLRRRYVHGGFAGTDTRFSLHLPPADRYEGRFFHYITPVPDSEHFSEHGVGEEDKVSFSIESGAAFLETNGGGRAAGDPTSGIDQTIGAYRANAAAARYARVIAEGMYGPHRVYGYAFGGSGGAFRTIGGAEHTIGVWDGVVPYVVGSPMAIPNCFTARMHALRVLRDRFDGIVDAMEPGGSGDPYTALNDEERAALLEVTRMGFPQRSWFAHRTMGMHALAVLYPGVRAIDPTYFDDFWALPGYLGADHPESFARDRVQHRTTIEAFLSEADLRAAGVGEISRPGESSGAADDAWLGSGGPEPRVAVRLSSAPPVDPGAAELLLESGGAAGARIVVIAVLGDIAVLGPADPLVVAALARADALVLDNSGFLAIQTYHRHQVPGPDFTVWDQFRDDDGDPLYPQRPMLLGPMMAAGASGSVQSGRFAGRMIVIESLLDREAYPWQADWYRARVIEHLGPETDDRFRLWMTDNALHGDFEQQEHPGHTVSFLGILHQALRDLAAWVERGVEPAASTRYQVTDGQVVVPGTAAGRRGIQPVVRLTANGGPRAEVGVGETVVLRAEAETPGVGSIVSAEWMTTDAGFGAVQRLDAAESMTVDCPVAFDAPGVYFPAVRMTAARDGRGDSRFARVQNVARVRVVVS